jgi:hypothetical protein
MDEPATSPRVVAVIDQYDDLAAALRRWFLDELGTTFAAVDAVAGLPERYAAKLLGAEPVKRVSVRYLLLLLDAGGLELQLVVNEAQLAKIRHRLTPTKPSAPFACSPVPDRKPCADIGGNRKTGPPPESPGWRSLCRDGVSPIQKIESRQRATMAMKIVATPGGTEVQNKGPRANAAVGCVSP